jgi:hypothetical protein
MIKFFHEFTFLRWIMAHHAKPRLGSVFSQYDIRLVAVGGGPLVAVASQQGLSPPFWQTPYPNSRGLSHGHAAQVVAGSGGLSKNVVGGQSQ